MAFKASTCALFSRFLPKNTPPKSLRARHNQSLQRAIFDTLEPRTLLSVSAVTGLSGVAGTIYKTTAPVMFTWSNADTNATLNLLEVKEAGNSNWFVLAQIAGNATSYTANGFSVDATYQVRMTTVDPSGAATSSAVTVVIPPWTNELPITTSVTTDSVDGTTYDILNWDEPDNSDIILDWYNRSTSNPFPSRWHGFTIAYDSYGTPGFYTNGYDSMWYTQGEDGAWEYGGDNAVQLEQDANIDGESVSDPTAAQEFTTTAPDFSFAAPTLSATYNANNTATLHISGEADPDNGDIYIVTENADTMTTDTSIDVGISAGSPHSWNRGGEYFVYQENDDDNYNLPNDLPPSGDWPVQYSAPSNWVDVEQALAPSFLQISPDGDGTSANVVWENTAYNETGYQLQRSTNGTTWSTLTTTPADTDQFEDTGLTAGTSYQYRVKAVRDGIGDGTLDSNFITTAYTAPLTKLTIVSFNSTTTNGIHFITKDPSPNAPVTNYPEGGEDSNGNTLIDLADGDASGPLCFTRNAIPTVTADFSAVGNLGPNFKIRGTTQGGITLTLTLNSEATGSGLAVSDFTGSNLPNTVDLDTLDIKWEVTYDGSTWVKAGESKNQVYITLGAPVAETLYETLLSVGCNGASGTSDATAAFNGIWAKFAAPATGIKTVAGTTLTYYHDMTTQNITTESLLEYGDGQCGAWAHFLLDTLKAQGISTNSDPNNPYANDYVFITPSNLNEGFIVNNWQFSTGGGTSGNASYPYYDIPTGSLITPSGYTWSYAEVTDQAGIPGQGGVSNPASLFNNHQMLCINGKFYDPSYGKEYDDLQGVDNSFAGFWIQTTISINGVATEVFEFRKNGANVNDITPTYDTQ